MRASRSSRLCCALNFLNGRERTLCGCFLACVDVPFSLTLTHKMKRKGRDREERKKIRKIKNIRCVCACASSAIRYITYVYVYSICVRACRCICVLCVVGKHAQCARAQTPELVRMIDGRKACRRACMRTCVSIPLGRACTQARNTNLRATFLHYYVLHIHTTHYCTQVSPQSSGHYTQAEYNMSVWVCWFVYGDGIAFTPRLAQTPPPPLPPNITSLNNTESIALLRAMLLPVADDASAQRVMTGLCTQLLLHS